MFFVTEDNVSYGLSFAMYPLCKIAVPIFLMISGATLLSKKETIRELFKKRVLKHIIIILVFGTLQFLRYVRTGKVVLSLSTWFTSIYCVPVLETYWFLYLYLGLLLLLPLLKKVVAVMERNDYIYLFALCIIFQLVCGIGYFTGYFINANIFSFSMVIFYPLMGCGIDKYCENIKIHSFIILAVLIEGVAIVLGIIYIKLFTENPAGVVSIFQLFVPLLATDFFVIFKVGSKNKNSIMIRTIGQAVFGIYLIEDIVRNQVEKVISKMNFSFMGSEFMLCMIYVFMSFVISLLIIISFRKFFSVISKKS